MKKGQRLVVVKNSNIRSPYKGLYQSYKDMRYRCENPNHKHYKIWGGRGIKVCDNWREDYNNFKQWALDSGWAQGLTIDRIDCDKDYCPENCRWIKRNEQSLNLRNTSLYECNGKLYSQKRLIELMWTLNPGDEVCIKKIKQNTVRVGNPYHHNHRNHLSK